MTGLRKWFRSTLSAKVACLCGLLAVAAASSGCESAPKKQAGPAGSGQANAGGERLRRPDGVRPDVPQTALEPRGLDLRWHFFLNEPVKGMWVIDETVYVYTAKTNIYCIGLDDGYVHWVYKLGDELSYPPGAYSYKKDGIARKDELFLVSHDVVHCIDKDAGYALWKLPLPFSAASAPSASASHVYIGSWDHRVYAIDKSDQTIGWSYRTGGPVSARAEAAEKTIEAVYIASEDGSVYSMNPVREERKWSYQTYDSIVARPLFFKGAFVYVGSKDFNLYCIRALDGNLEWRYATGAPVTKEPVAYTRDTIYVISGASNLLAVNLQPDAKKDYVRWSFDKGTDVIAKGRREVYVRDVNGDIVSLADETGKPRWDKPLTTNADFFATNPFDPRSLVERERRLASTMVLGYKDGWVIAVKEKNEF